MGEGLLFLLGKVDCVRMCDLAPLARVGGASLRGTMRRRVGPPDGHRVFEGGMHKEAYWTSARLRDAVRDLLLFETRQGRHDPYRAQRKLARLGVDFTP